MKKKSVLLLIFACAVICNSIASAENNYVLRSGAGTINISLPNEWKKHQDTQAPGAELENMGTFIRGNSAKEWTALIFINGKFDKWFSTLNTKESQMRFLAGFLKNEKLFDGRPVSSKYDEYFGVTCLVVSYISSKDNYIKDLFFVKNSALFKIAFSARDKETYEKEWLIVEQCLKDMEIQAVADEESNGLITQRGALQ